MSRKKSKRKCSFNNYSLHLYTIITIVLFFTTIATIATIAKAVQTFNDNNSKSDFTLIEAGDYKFKMYQYSTPHEKFTTLFIDESLKDFDVNVLNMPYDEKLYFHSKRELEDFYSFTKTDRTKLYVLIDSKHTDLQEEIESFNDFENICDVKDKTQIFNCGNTESDKTFVFIDDSLDLYPKNIAYWNLGIDPKYIGTIKDVSKFYTYYCENILPGGSIDLYNYNIYIIASNKNKKLIKVCKLLK